MRPVDLSAWPSPKALLVVVGISLMVGVAVASISPQVVALGILVSAAGIALSPFVRVYSARVVIFGLFVILLYAGSRDFAYLGLQVGRQRVFITEIVLIALWTSVIPDVLQRRRWLRNPLPGALVAFLAVGAIAFVRGLPTYGVDAVRDSALCYYSLAFPLVVLLASDKIRLQTLLRVCWIGWIVSGAVVVWRYVSGTGVALDYDLFRYGAGAQALASISSVGWGVASWSPEATRGMRVLMRMVALGQLGIGILLIQHRSLFVATIGTSLVVAYCCLPKKWMTGVGVASVLFVVMLLLALLPAEQLHLPAMLDDTLARIGSIVPHEDANAGWRLEIWKRAIRYGFEHPLLGAGFGPSLGNTLAFGESDRVDPHNSYVAIFFRMGLPGILTFGILWMQVIGGALARCRSGEGSNMTLALALAAHIAAALFAAFNVVLEGPYMGIPFWMSLALVYLATGLAKEDSAGQTALRRALRSPARAED